MTTNATAGGCTNQPPAGHPEPTPGVTVNHTDPTAARAAKAEALLLHFTAEAHRRKWDYDRGLDDDGVPLKSAAFDALHRLGEEMRTALEELRQMPAAASTVVSPPTDRADLLLDAADALGRMDYDTDSNDYGYDTYRDAWNGGVMDGAALLRRLAVEAHDTGTQQAEVRPCDGCGHPEHPAHACPVTLYGERCACDEPIADVPAPAAQQPAALRGELKPWQLLADAPAEPLPQTERVIGGRRLGPAEQQAAAADVEEPRP